jgi:hypothetical protein
MFRIATETVVDAGASPSDPDIPPLNSRMRQIGRGNNYVMELIVENIPESTLTLAVRFLTSLLDRINLDSAVDTYQPQTLM